MNKLIFAIVLCLMTTQAHAIGWFLLGYAVGESDGTKTTKIIKPSNSNRFLEVYDGGCQGYKERYRGHDSKTMIKSGYIVSFQEPHASESNYYGDKTKCTNVMTGTKAYHIRKPYSEVIKKLFGGKK